MLGRQLFNTGIPTPLVLEWNEKAALPTVGSSGDDDEVTSDGFVVDNRLGLLALPSTVFLLTAVFNSVL